MFAIYVHITVLLYYEFMMNCADVACCSLIHVSETVVRHVLVHDC
jgi:hypothetical protein